MASQAEIAETLRVVGEAEGAFRSRWRMSTLKRVDAELHQMLLEQIDLYSEDLMGGEQAPLQEQAAAMVRGWAAACRAMETQPDDAYLVGLDWATKTQVVISDSKQSFDLVKASAHPECVLVAMSPEEVARLVGGNRMARSVKQHFADAEILEPQSAVA